MALPLMAKATAVWLVDNTTMSFKQIADFCGLHELEVNGIADGEVAVGIKGFDPIANNQLDASEIEKAEKDVDQFLRVLEDDLKDKDWVAGRLSIVDFAVASTFVFRKEAGISLADFPHVVAWIERVEARPSWRKAIEPIVAAA